MNWSSIFTPTVLKVLFGMYLILLPTCLTWIVIAFEFEPSEYVIRELLLLAAIMIGLFYLYTIYKWVKKRNELYTRGSLGEKGDLGQRVINEIVEGASAITGEGDEFGMTTGDITAEQAEFYKDHYFTPWKTKINAAVVTIYKNRQELLNLTNHILKRLSLDKSKLNDNDRKNVIALFKDTGQTCGSNIIPNIDLSGLKTNKSVIITCINVSIMAKINKMTKTTIRKAIRRYLKANFKHMVIEKYKGNTIGSENEVYEEIDKLIDTRSVKDKEEFLDYVFEKLNTLIGNIDAMSVFIVHDLLLLNNFKDIIKVNIPSK